VSTVNQFTLSTISLPVRLGFKLSILTKLIVRDGSGDPETSHSYAAIGPNCWRSSHDAPLLSLLSMYISPSQQVSLAWCYGACCPLNPQLVEADGRPSWFWF